MLNEELIVNPDDYEEEKVIYDGKRSTISIVHPKSNEKSKIVMKKIPIKISFDPQKFAMREVLIMCQIHHPCIIKLLGVTFPSKNEQVFRIYTEYFPNNNLKVSLDKGISDDRKLTDTEKTKIIYGIASAMKYLHDRNIVHRDLKPEKVLLNSNCEPVLSDFSFSRIITESSLNVSNNLGTPFFMAPELFGDEEEVKISNKIDVYSFAMTLLSFFTMKYKFDVKTPRSITGFADLIRSGNRCIIPDEVPKFYKDLINSCWETNPDKRPSFSEIVNLFESSKDFLLGNADKDEVDQFINKIKECEADSNELTTSEKKSLTSSSTFERTTSEFDFS